MYSGDTVLFIVLALGILCIFLGFRKNESHLSDTQKNFRKQMEQLKREGKVVDEYGQKIKPKRKKWRMTAGVKIIIFLAIALLNISRIGNIIGSIIYNTSTLNNNNTSVYKPFSIQNTNSNNNFNIDLSLTTQKEISDYVQAINSIEHLSAEGLEMINKYIGKEHIYTEQEINDFKSRIENAKTIINTNKEIYKEVNTGLYELLSISETYINFIEKYKNKVPTYEIYQEIEYVYDLYIKAHNKTINSIFNLLQRNNMHPTVSNDGTIHYIYNGTYF